MLLLELLPAVHQNSRLKLSVLLGSSSRHKNYKRSPWVSIPSLKWWLVSHSSLQPSGSLFLRHSCAIAVTIFHIPRCHLPIDCLRHSCAIAITIFHIPRCHLPVDCLRHGCARAVTVLRFLIIKILVPGLVFNNPNAMASLSQWLQSNLPFTYSLGLVLLRIKDLSKNLYFSG